MKEDPHERDTSNESEFLFNINCMDDGIEKNRLTEYAINPIITASRVRLLIDTP